MPMGDGFKGKEMGKEESIREQMWFQGNRKVEDSTLRDARAIKGR